MKSYKKIQNILKQHKKELAEKFKVKEIAIFGSYVRGEQKENSDIDLIVEFEEPSFDNFMDLAFYLEKMFGKKVDILTPEGVRSIRIKKVAENIKKGIVYV